MSFLLGMKAKLLGIGALLLALIAARIRVKYLSNQRDKFKAKAEVAEKTVIRDRSIKAKEVVAEKEGVSRRKEAKREIEETHVSSELSKPDSDWV